MRVGVCPVVSERYVDSAVIGACEWSHRCLVATGCAVAVFLTPLTAVVSLLLLQQLLFRRLHNRVTHLLYGHLGAVD